MKEKTSDQSKVETRYILMPQDLNHHGTAFGGTIMSWIDITGAMAAQRHAENEVVTAHIDSISFLSSATLGCHILVNAWVTYVGHSSMEIKVTVKKEDPNTGSTDLMAQAFLTFVAINENHKPIHVPNLKVSTEEEIKAYQRAAKRVTRRKEEREDKH